MPFDAMPVQPDTVLTLLIDARAVLSDPSHWCKGTLKHGDAFCAMGAIGFVSTERNASFIYRLWVTPEQPEAIRLLSETIPIERPKYEHLTDKIDRWAYRVAGYNNDPDTTHAHMLAWFDLAIAARVTQLAELATATA